VPFGVMQDAAGASAEKARILPANNVFNGRAGMIAWLRKNIPSDCFL